MRAALQSLDKACRYLEDATRPDAETASAMQLAALPRKVPSRGLKTFDAPLRTRRTSRRKLRASANHTTQGGNVVKANLTLAVVVAAHFPLAAYVHDRSGGADGGTDTSGNHNDDEHWGVLPFAHLSGGKHAA